PGGSSGQPGGGLGPRRHGPPGSGPFGGGSGQRGGGGSGQPGGGSGQLGGGSGQLGGGSGQPGGGSGQLGGGSGQLGGGSGQLGGSSGQPGGGSGQPGGGLGEPGGAPERPPTGIPTSQPGNAANAPITEIAPAVQFQQNKRIQGSDQWVDSNYEVFRNYRSEWHDRDWWRSHQSRIVFGVGGWYYWNAGYWYPAWGYDPNAYYAYDGPIYGYNDLPPDQVIADVQEALQQQGYYQGEVDGLLGPPTCAAIADYQRDHGLYITSA